MFRFFSKMTELTDNTIDFTRIGALARTNHHYSQEEVITRLKILTTAAILGCCGAYLNNPEKTGCDTAVLGVAVSALGLYLSHRIVMSRVVEKRREMNRQCAELIRDIQARTDFLSEKGMIDSTFKRKILSVVDQISRLTLTDGNFSGGATHLIGRKKTLLSQVKKSLEDPARINDFWSDVGAPRKSP